MYGSLHFTTIQVNEVIILVKIVRSKEIEDYLNNLASEIEIHYNLPDLKVSVTQIKWARDIRIKFLNEAHDKDKHLETLFPLQNKTSASWWINNKDLTLDEIIAKTT
ncbi:hypothetical protein [Paenibacillus xylanexedens]|uniref:hypothetical protein n=1 Tax=Paenibacillus xylanexedens TaxID=528191 RepID=UPI00119F65D9|nr:hypothetical protein [Paenibacillus xylanexedens]